VLVIMAKPLGTALPFMRLINLGGICGRGDPILLTCFPFHLPLLFGVPAVVNVK
jgi:hypothetical protein